MGLSSSLWGWGQNHKYIDMKRMLFVVLVVFTFTHCRKPDVPDFPLIQTGEVSGISESGATFTAKIISLGKTQVESYGFVWGLKANPDFNSSTLSMSENASTGVFSAIITYDLFPDTTYYVRAFITDDITITFGKTVTFRSKGSMAPVITDFHPKSGVENTVVVINGDHFSEKLTGNKVQFGSYTAMVERASKTELEVVLPDAINISGYVDIVIETANHLTKSPQKFLFEGCIVTGFYPAVARGNGIVKIFTEHCRNMDSDTNPGFAHVGGYNAVIQSINDDAITVKLNHNTPPGRHPIRISKDGKVTFSSDSILITTPWSKLAVTPPMIRQNLSGFQIGNDLYIGLGAVRSGSNFVLMKDFYHFVPDQQQWVAVEDIPSQVRETSPSFTLNGKGYIFLGVNAEQSMLEQETFAFDPQSGIWSPKAGFPLPTRWHAVGFEIGNYGYAGLGRYRRDLWQYNPIDDSWLRMDDFPIDNTEGAFAVAHGDRAYVGMGRRLQTFTGLDIYVFSPNVIGNWSLLTTFPGEFRFLPTAFVIDDYLYVGLGERQNNYLTDLWRYDLVNDSWERQADFPFTRRSKPQVFIVDGKAIFVSGYAWNMAEDETFVIFDPN
jgi:N-acetylneuraminic acid mutarotase